MIQALDSKTVLVVIVEYYLHGYICRALLLVDPTDREESVMDGQMMIAMNVDREICAVQMNGGLSLEADQVLRVISM